MLLINQDVVIEPHEGTWKSKVRKKWAAFIIELSTSVAALTLRERSHNVFSLHNDSNLFLLLKRGCSDQDWLIDFEDRKRKNEIRYADDWEETDVKLCVFSVLLFLSFAGKNVSIVVNYLETQ